MLEVDPILPPAGSSEPPIRYFALRDLRYHGHDLTLVYDADGTPSRLGAGLSIFCDGRRLSGPAPLRRTVLRLPRGLLAHPSTRVDLAVNVWNRAPSPFEPDLPIASASSTADDARLYEAIDGRLWFFVEIANGWSPATSGSPDFSDPWFAVNLRIPPESMRRTRLFSDGKQYQPSATYRLQVLSAGEWKDVAGQRRSSSLPIANGVNEVRFHAVDAQQFRVVVRPQLKTATVRLVEFKLFGP